jgi:hypothetical protein
MARPWIEFVQTQLIPWREDGLAPARRGVDCKRLSTDNETGACSLLVRYPAGWRSPGGALAVDEEFLVLDGELVIGEEVHGDKSFAHLPAGFASGVWSSERGAVLLEFFSGTPARGNGAAGFDPRRLVVNRDVFAVPYTGNFHPEFPPGAGRKVLYEDPLTHDTSWILGTMPIRWAERAEVHPTVEELYLLSGEVHGNRGIMRPGAYFWRPPSVAHGPFGTQTGNLYFFRTKGGNLSTTYVEPEKKFHWNPRYDPVLPPELEACRGEVPPGPRCW